MTTVKTESSIGGRAGLDMSAIAYSIVEGPFGPFLVAGDGQGLRYASFLAAEHPYPADPRWRRDDVALDEVRRQLAAYFRREVRRFDLPLKPVGTPFQQAVWAAMREIPYGRTLSYGELAERAGNRLASRAAGAACGQNPLPLLQPCHRVVGSTGKLTGFQGGLRLKERLLAFEEESLFP